MPRRIFDIIDADSGRITAVTGNIFPYDSIRVGGRNYVRSDFSQEDGAWVGIYRDAELGGVDPWDVWNDVFTANDGSVSIFQHSVGEKVPPTEFVRFRKSESPFVPLVISPSPQPPQQSLGSYLRQQRDAVFPDHERNRYGAATSEGRFVPAYFSGMDTRTPEGLGFPGRLVLASSLPGAKKK